MMYTNRAQEIVRGLANAKMERDPPSRVEAEERECAEDRDDRDSGSIVEEDEVAITRQMPLVHDPSIDRAVPRPVARTRPKAAAPASIDKTVTDNRDGTERQRPSQRNEQKRFDFVGTDAMQDIQNSAERIPTTRECHT